MFKCINWISELFGIIFGIKRENQSSFSLSSISAIDFERSVNEVFKYSFVIHGILLKKSVVLLLG